MSAWQPDLDFDAAEAAADTGEALTLELDGFEGPLHVLLALARTQKVDLLQLSVLKLAEQYAAFVRLARRRSFALAADYLVMASWLAYLKSRLLLPKPEKLTEEPPAEIMAAALAFRLAKLDAMRTAVEALQARPQLNRDVFGRGDPEAIRIVPTGRPDANLNDLLRALVAPVKATAERRYAPRPVQAYALELARERLRTLLPELDAWTTIDGIAPGRADVGEGPTRASCLASTLSAGLELVKEGAMEARQREAFADLYVRRRALVELDEAA